ncbi:hypothetical protein NITLEN_20377 [Nitrospira lenta]|uniref:Uncharacterized protein n=1 Tax=Nitrospira lenta TaxID=1436998 RepID=A0A330L4X5_9BACT|nr:hypothetical protein NITLEN_20377 [Nitrospira lenta]
MADSRPPQAASPKHVPGIEGRGTAESVRPRSAQRASDSLTFLEQQGMYPHEAMEMIRDQVFPPSEEDVPNLGETMQPYSDKAPDIQIR